MNNSEQIKKIEKKFLAYLFKEKRYIAASLGKIKKEHLPNYGMIYNLLVSYYNKFKDIVTDDMANTWFQKRNVDIDTITNYKILISELRNTPIENDGEFDALINELKDYRKRQDYCELAKMIVETNPVDCPTQILEKMENKIKETVVALTSDTSETRKEGSIKDSVQERKERYNQIKSNPEMIKTIRTGFKRIDDAEGGFRPGELIYVIGRKGDGKSVLLLNLAHNAWEQGENVLLFSLEISKEDYERRFDARAAGVSSNGLKRGTLTEVEEALYNKYLEGLTSGVTPSGKQAGTFYVVDCPGGCTPAYVDSKIETLEQLLGIKFGVVITDYAGIMRPNIAVDAKRHEQGQIALDLKRIARTRDCVVISAAQMNRKGKDDASGKEGKADTAHVAESDQVSDHIDWGIAIRSISDTSGKVESFKTRDAAPFEFHFNKKYSCMKIEELDDSLGQWDNLGGPL